VTQPAGYATATAFRQALEARLMNIAKAEQVDIQRLRRQVAFDRVLCRLFRQADAPWALKCVFRSKSAGQTGVKSATQTGVKSAG